MPDRNPKILVLGATGQVGKGVVEILKNNPGVEVIDGTRRIMRRAIFGAPRVSGTNR